MLLSEFPFLPLVPFSLQNIYTLTLFESNIIKTSKDVELVRMSEVRTWTAWTDSLFSPPGHANCYFSMVIRCSVQARRGLFPCSSFMWFNEVSGEWLSLCLLSCNSSPLIACFCLAQSLTRCWMYVFVSPLAEHVVLFVMGSSSVTDCPAGAASTWFWVRCLFRLRHRGADPDPDSYAN